MDAMVTARVPVEVKRQGDEVLRKMGSSTTRLVNAAYAFVIETGHLPEAEHAGSAAGTSLSESQRAEIISFFERSSSPAPEAFWEDFTTYDELLAEGRAADYEALG